VGHQAQRLVEGGVGRPIGAVEEAVREVDATNLVTRRALGTVDGLARTGPAADDGTAVLTASHDPAVLAASDTVITLD